MVIASIEDAAVIQKILSGISNLDTIFPDNPKYEIPKKNVFQMTLIQNDDVISTLSPNTSIESFNIAILPRATICTHYLLDTH
jgi:hypothetical protein